MIIRHWFTCMYIVRPINFAFSFISSTVNSLSSVNIFVYRSSLDNLDIMLAGNCIALLFTDKASSCFNKLKVLKRKSRFEEEDNMAIALKSLLDLPLRLTGFNVELGILSTNQERLKNTLNQYPWLCSLKTR